MIPYLYGQFRPFTFRWGAKYFAPRLTGDKMKKFLAFILVTSIGYAQDVTLAFGYNLSGETNKSIYKYGTNGVNGTQKPHNGDTNFSPSVDLSYSRAVKGPLSIALGVSYDLSSNKAGSEYGLYSGTVYSSETEISNHYTIYIQPTYDLGHHTSVFATLGFDKATITTVDKNGLWVYNPGTFKKNTNGKTYGIGIQHNLNDKFNIQFSVKYTGYDDISFTTATGPVNFTQKVGSAGAGFSIGYKF